jgi:hypothetical protein
MSIEHLGPAAATIGGGFFVGAFFPQKKEVKEQ